LQNKLATVSDGASAFRLQQKKATSGQGRGTANIFVSSERVDDTRPDSVINMLSDISHLIKKAVTILHTSSPTYKSRFLKIPDYLVQMVFRTRPFPGDGHRTACRAPPQDLEARRGHLEGLIRSHTAELHLEAAPSTTSWHG